MGFSLGCRISVVCTLGTPPAFFKQHLPLQHSCNNTDNETFPEKVIFRDIGEGSN